MTSTVRPPAHYDRSLDAVVVSGYEAAVAVLRDARGWSSDIGANPVLTARLGGPAATLPLANGMLFMDPPRHTRLRRLVGPYFAAGRIAALRPRVRAIVDATLDGLTGAPEFDVVAELAYPVPVAVIAELLDIGPDGAQIIRDTARRLVGILELQPTEEQLVESAEAFLTCTMFLLPLLTERQREPGADLVSDLLRAEADGERITFDEALATVLLLLMAGHEITANLIANGVLRLLRHPDQLELLRQRPELIGPAVDELLRLDGAAKLISRTATRDCVVAGVPMREGQRLVVDVHAANRDPARFPDPERFDITRAGGPGHLAFGAGPHFCVGWALAKAEAEETLQRLFARFDQLRLREEPVLRESTTFHALERLDVHIRQHVV